MQEYIVFFEIYGKKLKTKVQANDEIQAMEIIKSSITVIKVEKEKILTPNFESDEFQNYFGELLDFMKKKK